LNSICPDEEVVPLIGFVIRHIGSSIIVTAVGILCWAPIEQYSNIGIGLIKMALADTGKPAIGKFARSNNVITPRQSPPNMLKSAEYKTLGKLVIRKAPGILSCVIREGSVIKYPMASINTNSQNCTNTKGKSQRERVPEVPTNQVILIK
jgi:hypothetical protein